MDAPIQGTVVAVSTDPDVADELRFGLPRGLDTVGAIDARAAWKELGALRSVPRAIVMDLQTGSAGGFGLARDLHQSERFRDLPIVMLIERDQDEWLARQAGAHAVLRKPLEPAVLVDVVLSVLSEAPH